MRSIADKSLLNEASLRAHLPECSLRVEDALWGFYRPRGGLDKPGGCAQAGLKRARDGREGGDAREITGPGRKFARADVGQAQACSKLTRMGMKGEMEFMMNRVAAALRTKTAG